MEKTMQKFLWISLSLSLTLACSGDTEDTDPADDTSTADNNETFKEYIFVDVPASGDFSDFPGCQDHDSCEWLSQTLADGVQNLVSMEGQILDFETDDAVPDATLEVWYGDEVVGPADLEVVSDASGNVSGSLMTCTPQALLVSTDPLLEETKPTYEFHGIYDAGESLSGQEFNSVSEVTYRIIPSLLGVSPDPEKGTAAGTAYDRLGEEVEGAQVIVRDKDTGAIADGVVVKYFVDDFPNRNQPHTSPDGLWVAINIPVGSWRVEMWIWDEASSSHLLVGATVMDVIADSINISSTYAGYNDGVVYPDSCVEGGGESGDEGGDESGDEGGDESGDEGGDEGGEDTGDAGGEDTGGAGGEDTGR
jgi:hypothetical protein